MVTVKKVYFPVRDKPIKVALYSNGPNLPTGYAKVLREITHRLKNDNRFEVSIINENWFGDQVTDWDGMKMYGIPLPMRGGEPDRSKMYEGFMKTCERIKPDAVIILEDSFTLFNYGFHNLVKTPFKRIFYMPLDGGWIPDIGLPPTRTMEKLVSMAKFTQDALKKEGFNSDMIWHGVDLELFYPINPGYQEQLKIKYGFKPTDKVIYNYGRNSNIRKNNQGMMWSLAKYLATAPDNHYALLHILDPRFPGNDLIDYKERHLKLEFPEEAVDRIRFTNYSYDRPASDREVAEMIQMSDLIVTASTGEGFGLIMAEAMACGKVVVSTDYTTPYELLKDTSMGIGERGFLVPVAATFVAGLSTEHAYVDKEEFAKTIRYALKNPGVCREMGINGRLFAEKYLNWDYLVEQWKDVIIKTVN